MEIVGFKAFKGNFGDDLNGAMWNRILPPEVFEIPDTLLVGIGSILHDEMLPISRTQNKRVFVLGTGAGYGKLPPGMESWRILAVRGPLTARLLGRPELAATDAAALMATIPEMIRLEDQRNEILFMPHHRSIEGANWEQVAANCGLTFVDPQWSVETILQYYSRAKLVVTEAMHGAIVADTMRIPWIPVTMNPNVPAFKWNDWGQALRVPFAPHDLGGSSFFEALRHRMIVRQAAQQGSVPAGLVSSDTVDALVTDHLQRHETKTGPTKRHWYEAESVRELARKSTRLMDPFFVQQATRRLRNIDLEKCYLSSDLIFQQKLEQLIEAKDVLVRELLG